MTEYRVVCTLDTEHGDGSKYHTENSSCWWSGKPHKMIMTNYDIAKMYLETAKQECPKFDRMTEERFKKNPRDSIKHKQSNIRIQSREVTDWK